MPIPLLSEYDIVPLIMIFMSSMNGMIEDFRNRSIHAPQRFLAACRMYQTQTALSIIKDSSIHRYIAFITLWIAFISNLVCPLGLTVPSPSQTMVLLRTTEEYGWAQDMVVLHIMRRREI